MMSSFSSTVLSASNEVIDRFLANVDVWQTMFEMLSVKDRIRLEMTNKRLGVLMFEYWKRVTSFHSFSMSRNAKKLSALLIAICVNRIGDGLRSLTISESAPLIVCSAHLPSIGEGCPNVEVINFVFEDIYGTLDIRLDSFSRLKTLTVSGGLVKLIRASASRFLRIPTSIEVIRGLKLNSKEPFKNAAEMEGFFADRPSLREVYLGDLFTRDGSKGDMFRVIAERCPHLKSIKLPYYNSCIDYSGVIALESMKDLRIFDAKFDEMEIATICERSPLVEALELCLHFSSNIDLQSAALNALGSLTKLRELDLGICSRYENVVAPSLVTEFVRDLARNSGASLRRLHLGYTMPLPTAAIDALANGCPKLRYVRFHVDVGEAEPASIRFLIDCIVAHPSWIVQRGQPTLEMKIYVKRDSGDEYIAGLAAFKALAAPAANLLSGVQLKIC